MARGNQQPGQFLVDGIGTLDAGMNAGLSAQLIPPNQASMSTNMTFRGGYGTHRPVVREISLDFKGDLVLQESCIRKNFQGACFYQPDTGPQSLVAAIGGRLFQFFPEGTKSTVLDVTIANDPNPITQQQAWLWQSERFVIWNDGASLPVFFDGNTSRRSNGTNKVLATIVGTFNAPAVGSTVVVTVSAPYTGPLNLPVLVNGNQFTLLSTQTNQPSALMTAIYDPDTTHAIGESIINFQTRLGTLLSDIPAGVQTIQATSSVLPSTTIGQVVTIGNCQFTVTGGDFSSPDKGIYKTQRLFLKVVQPPPFQFGFQTPGFNPPPNSAVTPNLIPSGSLILVSSSAPSPTVGTVGSVFSPSTSGSPIVVNPTFTLQPQIVWVGLGQYFIDPVAVPPSTQLVLQNVGATPGDAMTGDIIALPELPPGRMGTYGLGRNWMALTDGFSFIASDIDGGTSGTEVYNFRDAPLRVTENSYLAGGGAFRVPGALGDIRAMRFSATLDVSLGQGPLQVFTTQAAFSCAAPSDRTTWGMLTNPILTQSLLGAGALSQNGTVNVNGDILFRAIDGIRSLILARRDFDTWGNVPQSREVETILAQDNATLVQFESLAQFDNRALLSILPTNGPLGVFHQGIIALNEDPISTLRGKSPSIYDGLWTGLNVFQFVAGTFNGVERCYAFCYDSVLSRIRLFEIQKTDAAAFDNDTTPVTYSFESASLFVNPKIKGAFDLAELMDGEIYISDLRGVANFETWWKNSFSDCWNKWVSFGVCGSNTDTSTPLQFRAPLGMGSPPVEVCDPNTNMPARIGLNFQVRIQITGSCRFRGAKFKAVPVPETRLSVPICKPLCVAVQEASNEPCEPCVSIDNCIRFPLVLYNLNANKTYQNISQSVGVTCPDGTIQTVVVPAGTISYTLPFPPGFSGDYPPLVMNCLSGGVIVKTIPSGANQEQIDAIVNEMLGECVQAYAQSLAQCGPKLFSSEQVSVEHQCAEGTTLQFSGTLPGWIIVDSGTSTVIGNAGAVTSEISIADATAKAQAQLQSWVDAELTSGNLSCASPSNICTDGIGSLATNRYGIDGYTDGMIPNPSDPSVKPAWDGTFSGYMDGNNEGPNPGEIGWGTGGTGVNGISISGNKACSVQLLFNGCIDGIPQWELDIFDINNQPIWQGVKIDGQTPEGVFNLTGGVDVSPLTLTIVLVDQTATPIDHSLSCVS